MDELRSTDILDKEILADAKKKSEKILQRAEEECKKILEGVEERVETELKKSSELLQNKFVLFERDLNASVPLEKERFLVSFIQSSFMKQINDYLEKIGEDKRLEIVMNRAKKINLQGKSYKAYVYGFDTAKAKKVLSALLGKSLLSVEKTDFNKIIYEDFELSNNEGIILVSEDTSIKCRLTLSQIFEEIIDKYRAELSETLFGKEGI